MIRAQIFRASEQDYSNGGLSSRVREVTVTAPGVYGPDMFDAERHPLVVIVRRECGNETLVHAEPADRPAGAEGALGPMMGGTFIYSPDSRFAAMAGGYFAVPFHDRYETPRQNAMVSA